MPLDEPMVPRAVLLLLHVPPAVASDIVTVEFTQTIGVPVIDAGSGLTVIAFDEVQPPGSVYTIFRLPAATPVTTPDTDPTVANDVLLLLHVPPVEVLARVIVAFTHTADGPVTAAGCGFTVIG